ncbi:gliding motility-associated ABC transporter permease subunit GldF [Paucihalobacter ruber]|uniref:Gliding motility-associated ABC transporter permease subunit GldF n=1 Tax=Paucihalobacter ruber TaxID=2567861 RepID=A0A506PIW6_9FLAO|nr:gliding motility-associated ABC transporter permease subunit GldF [Paucihalobacter ruber]TPV33315.1 gliding motility-associated ABC transporter permease subunit GldF [Paucihalobacter ruber]
MKAIFIKEINSFFASPIGYLVVGIFLIINGLFLFVFKGEFNILDNGFADLSAFFVLAPWVFLFLVPAVTMRSFSEERKQGTIEVLLTKPISSFQLVFGKFLGSFTLIFIALLPTLLYVFTIWQLGNPVGNLDLAATTGSYIGLLFLAATFTAIGVFASTLSQNQIVAFIITILLCFIMLYGFDGLADLNVLNNTFKIETLGLNYHFNSVSRGVIDTRNLIYFVSVTTVFLVFTKLNLNQIKQ